MTADPIRECCRTQVAGVYFCDIDGCFSTDTVHVEGYPDCLHLCPEHKTFHDECETAGES